MGAYRYTDTLTSSVLSIQFADNHKTRLLLAIIQRYIGERDLSVISMKPINRYQSLKPNLRTVNAIDDMPAVLDLIEIGFKNELDPQGWKLLNQMRNIARQTGFLRIRGALRTDSAGFVWVEDGHIVANLSLRIALPSVTRGRLIGNVVVHPNYRGKGISRALVEAAIQAARNEGARWIGLEVRQQNDVAFGLYQRLGFHQVGTMIHLLHRADLPWNNVNITKKQWHKSLPQDKHHWVNLADSIYGHVQKRVLEIRDYQYVYGGIKRWINLWVNAERESAWLSNQANPRCAVCIKTDCRYHFHVWHMLMHTDEDEGCAQEIVAKAISETHHSPPWTVIAMVANHHPLITTMKNAGFHVHRTLLQMVLEL